MMKIAIISDTHGSLNPKTLGCLCGCDQIIHAGDIGSPSILTELEEIAPVTAVLGNNDYEFYPKGINHKTLSIEFEGVLFVINHIPRMLMKDLNGIVGYYKNKIGSHPTTVAIHGHTHIPNIETNVKAKPADVLVCPGSVSRPRNSFPSFCKIIVDDGKILKCEIAKIE